MALLSCFTLISHNIPPESAQSRNLEKSYRIIEESCILRSFLNGTLTLCDVGAGSLTCLYLIPVPEVLFDPLRDSVELQPFRGDSASAARKVCQRGHSKPFRERTLRALSRMEVLGTMQKVKSALKEDSVPDGRLS